jgi:hypothetical protein
LKSVVSTEKYSVYQQLDLISAARPAAEFCPFGSGLAADFSGWAVSTLIPAANLRDHRPGY